MNNLNDAVSNVKNAINIELQKIKIIDQYSEVIQIRNLKNNVAIKNIINKYFIYIISLNTKVNSDVILLHYNNTKNKNGKRPPINTINNYDKNKVLYVGKSATNISLRLNQHLNLDKNSNKTTSALRLSDWLMDIPGEITVQYFSLNTNEQILLSTFEQYLHEELKPLFGLK